MIRNRWSFGALLIPAGLAVVLIMGADSSHAVGLGGAIDPTCTSPMPCIEYQNNGGGPGIRGDSVKGNGVKGDTTFTGSTSTNFRAGVYGQDAATSGDFNAGVEGKSVHGFGVFGNSANNDGVNASTTNDSKFFGVGHSGVFGHDDSTDGGFLNAGVTGFSTSGFGVQAHSQGWIGANVMGGALFTTFEAPALSIVENANGATVLIDACSSGTTYCLPNSSEQVMELEASGELFIKGEIVTSGSCVTGCIVGNRETRVLTYAPHVAQPTSEDYGEANLVRGQAYVRLDPTFANTIDRTAGYLVFLTPEGPSRGLYVTAKSIGGFAVRENPGGQSTIAFQYRIVARPFGVHDQRLALRYYRHAR